MSHQQLFSQLEDYSDDIIRKTRKYIPFVGRLLMLSTFWEDGLRLWTQYGDQREFFEYNWHFPWLLSTTIVILTGFIQLLAPVTILLRKNVKIACISLGGVVITQIIVYHVYTDFRFLIRSISILGGLILLIAETLTEKQLDPGATLPKMDDLVNTKSLFVLVARIYLCLMIVSLLHLKNFGFFKLIEVAFSVAIGMSLSAGFKTKQIAFLAAVWLFVSNFFVHNWFVVYDDERDYTKYDFFQQLSAVGGFLLLIHVGPGEVSIDDAKKQW